MKTVVIIQARMSSTRLPGKVLLPLARRSVLSHVVGRVQQCSTVDEVVVATSTAKLDDAVAGEAQRCNAVVFRGSEADVLDRYYEAARLHHAHVVVRVTADCPLLDPHLMDQMVQRFRAQTRAAPIDYLANGLRRTYPRGLDAEVFTAEALRMARRYAREPHEREHVTPYIYEHPETFSLYPFTASVDLSHHRWTLDTPEDYQLLTAIFDGLSANACFTTADVLTLLERNPELSQVNSHIRQKALIDA